MTAVFAFLAILLATLTGHAPAVPAAAAAALPHHSQVGQSTSAHRAPARSAAPVVAVPRDVPAPAPVTHPATVAAPTVAPPAIATTDVDPEDGRMCLDPIDCPPGQ